MSLSDSQISMRPLCSDSLFSLVDYIFVIFLMKCMSWLLGVQSSFPSSDCIYTIISLLFYCFEYVIQLWVVTRALGLKKWLKSQGCWHNTVQKFPICWIASLLDRLEVPERWHAHNMRASRGQAVQKLSGTQGLVGRKVG